jgi:asparagine synthase (glutamine-hydrolysing)
MGVCGRIATVDHTPPDVERTLAALSIGPARLHRHWAGAAARLASCDEGVLATNGRGDAAAFDGRIDNRDELRRALRRDDLDRCDNAQVALLCYETWGDDFCDRIVGDYGCAIWDARQRRLVMAADPGALRPLYYWLGAGEILFASETRGLWSNPDVPKALDEDRLAVWLCMLPVEPERSFFRDIFRVPPGHRVIWQAGTARIERWWHPENVPELKLAGDRDYEEAVRSCLEEAVRCRLGGDELVGATLSGGMDSSAVTAVAARLLAGQGRRLTAFTAAPSHPVDDEPDRFVDEWPYAAAVAAMYPNIDHVRIDSDNTPILDELDLREAGQDCPVLSPAAAVVGDGIGRAARERRIAIMLGGAMGNMSISYDGGELLAAQLRSANMLGAAHTIRDLRRFGGRSRLGLLGEVADSILPPAARRALRRAVGTPEPRLSDFSIVAPEFVRRRGFEQRAREVAGNIKNVTRGNSRALRLAIFNRSDQRSYACAGTRRLFRVDPRDPTADRRLIELCLSIPDTQFLHNGVYRSLIRRSMAGLVPEQILQERRKGLPNADWRFGFDAAVPKLAGELERLRASPLARECLDLSRMQALLDRWPGPNDPERAKVRDYMTGFSRGLAAGRFIRRIEGGNL